MIVSDAKELAALYDIDFSYSPTYNGWFLKQSGQSNLTSVYLSESELSAMESDAFIDFVKSLSSRAGVHLLRQG